MTAVCRLCRVGTRYRVIEFQIECKEEVAVDGKHGDQHGAPDGYDPSTGTQFLTFQRLPDRDDTFYRQGDQTPRR